MVCYESRLVEEIIEGGRLKLDIIYNGDCLVRIKQLPNESIDLIYLDPPFCKQKDREYKDTWKWNEEIESYYNIIKNNKAIKAFDILLGRNYLFAYLVYMAIRLEELHRVLKSTGSIYLHCDPTASHYLKLVMDAVFEHKNFCNEIIWSYKRWSSATNRFQRLHDVILFYAKSQNHVFNVLYEPYAESTMKRWKGIKRKTTILEDGKLLQVEDNEGQKGAKMGSVWPIKLIIGANPERLGYPTQKPETLLDRIIKASSNEGDVVLDPFCGCGTTVTVAEKLKRNWIGIDISPTAVKLANERLQATRKTLKEK